MRLIAFFTSEKQVIDFSDFLIRNKIANQYEQVIEKGVTSFSIWVHDEKDLTSAFDYYQLFVLQPEHPRFLPKQKPEQPFVPLSENKQKEKFHQKILFFSLTHSLLIICCFLFIWNVRQESELKKTVQEGMGVSEFMLTPLQQALFFDDPKAMKEMQKLIEKYSISSLEELKTEPLEVQRAFQTAKKEPLWQGAFQSVLEKIQKGTFGEPAPLFEKIQEGEVWRFISPVFMHRDFLHIFFNMAWFLILGKQIEARLKKPRMLLLILLLAIFSNTAQYLMSGAYFLGFSGVITGLAGFIWSRQKKAPWEVYPLNRSTALFLFYFVLILFFISVVCFMLKAFTGKDFDSSMANTAHISGGLLGLALGRCSFFSRRLI